MGSGFVKSDEGEGVILPSTPHSIRHRFYQHEQEDILCAGHLLKQFNESELSASYLSISSNVVGCSFCPYDDNLLLTVVGFGGRTTAGYVQMWDLEGENEESMAPFPVSCNYFTYSPFPACQFSSNGGFVTAIINNGVGHLTILEMKEDDELAPCNVHCKGNNLLRGRVKCCVLSQDNQKAVTISNVALSTFNHDSINEVCIWRINSQQSMKSVWQASCEVLCPEFRGNVHSCVLSPNSEYLAISSTLGQSIILDCNVFVTVSLTNLRCLALEAPVGPLTCQYNPKFACKLLFCYGDTWCCLRDLEIGLHRQDAFSLIVEDQSVTANACAFASDGEHFAVALSNATVVLCDADTLDKVFEVKPSFPLLTSELQAFSVAITRSCQELAVGYNNGYVCIWQLPARLHLKHLCRLVILKLISPDKIPLLPLPRKLISYLLFTFQKQLNFTHE